MRSLRWLAFAAALIVALGTLVPFLYMVSTSLPDGRADAYRAAWAALPFSRFFLNSVIVSAVVSAGQVATSAAAAFALARLRFPGRDDVFLALVAVLGVPPLVLLVPRFLMIDAFGWVDTYAGLISTELVSIWGIFLLRQFFVSLPPGLEEAARLDGADEWTIFTRVILPLSRPALATLAVVAFVDQWKSFLWPFVVTRSLRMQVAEVGLATLQGTNYGAWPLLMAAAVFVTLPLFMIGLFAQRYVIRGVSVTGWS